MNKRIIISESEKKRILSQHKQTIQNESDLKKQSLSERELSNLVGRVLIKEQLEQIPGLPEGMGDCLSKISVIKGNTKMQIKIANSCMSFDVETCSKAIMEVGVELGTKVLTNPTILVDFGKDVIEFAKCMSEKFEMDPMDLPIENLTSSNTTEMKEGVPKSCKSKSDCPPGQSCVSGKCQITTSAKEMKEDSTKPTGASKIPGCPPFLNFCPAANTCCPRGTDCTMQGCKPKFGPTRPGIPPMNEETDEVIYEIEFNEESDFKRNCCRRGCRGTSEICNSECRCVPRVTWGPSLSQKDLKEESDEIGEGAYGRCQPGEEWTEVTFPDGTRGYRCVNMKTGTVRKV